MANITVLDYAKAKAFTLWAGHATGIEPEIINVDNKYLEIDFNKQEIQAWGKYLDQSIFKALKPAPPGTEPPTIQIRFGKVLLPWASRYIIALLIGGVIIGRLSKR